MGFAAFLYSALKRYIRGTLPLYFRRVHLRGIENVPDSGPVIFAPNHQNAFMDALLTAVFSGREPVFLARADIFGNRITDFLLGILKVMPVYRMRDGQDKLGENQAVFENCADILEAGGSLLIFPEASHHPDRRLRTLRKGISRIAFATMERGKPTKGLQIIPVGLTYMDPIRWNSEVFVSFGEGIPVDQFMETYLAQPARGMKRLLETVSEKLRPLALDIPEGEFYPLTDRLLHFREEITRGNKEPWDRVAEQQSLAIRLTETFKENPEEARRISEVLEREEDPARLNPQTTAATSLYAQAGGFLISMYALLNHLPGLGIIRWILKKTVHQSAYLHSIRFAAAIFLFPVLYLFLAMLVGLASGSAWISLVYFVSLPVSAVLAIRFWHSFPVNGHGGEPSLKIRRFLESLID